MDIETKSSRDVLRIGDLISLKLPKNDGWLCADGILDQVYACKNPEYIEDVLWEVYVQNQYNCAKDYKETAAIGVSSSRDPAKAGLLLEQLKNAEVNEMNLNKKLMTMKIGKPVAFGDIIQLKHMKSKKMLTVLDTVLAKTERENMRIVLTKEGDSLSWLELVPRHKYDHEGQLITDNAELYIRVRERSGEYVHSAKKMAANDPHREINSSLDNTSWMMYIYQHAPDAASRNIMAGQLITLQEIEMSSYITLDSCSPGITHEANVVVSPVTQLSNVAADCNIGTGMLWMVEKKDFQHGGTLSSRGAKLSLRHFNSGLFMKFANGAVTAVVDRAEATYFDFVISQNSDGGSTLQEGCSIQLNYQGSWLSLQRTGAERKCIAVKDKTQAIQLAVSARAFRLFDSDLYMCNECSRRMRVFETLVSMKMLQDNKNTEYIIRSLFSVLEQLDEFLNPDDATVSRMFSRMGVAAPLVTAREELCVMRQTILREQGGLDAIILLLKCHLENKIPEGISFDRKHLSILGQVGATDLNRIKPKKRVLETPDTTQQSKTTSGKQKFAGAARSIAAINKMKKAAEDGGSAVPKATTSDDDSVNMSHDAFDSDAGSGHEVGGMLAVARFVGGFKRKKKKKAISPPASNKSMKSDSESEKATTAAPRFLFKHMGMSIRTLMTATSMKQGTDKHKGGVDSDIEISHDAAEVRQLQALDEMHAGLGAYLSHFCLKVLLSGLTNNRPNQMHLADSLDVVLSQVMENPVAVFCVQTMLQGNLAMLQNKIKEREIQMFLNLVRDNSMNATFIKLLENTCVCPMGIDATQRIISISLFGESERDSVPDMSQFTTANNAHQVLLDRAKGDRASISLATKTTCLQPVIVSISTDTRAIHKAVWSESKLYFPASEELSRTVLGSEVISRGVPKLYILWNEQEGYKMFNLFGYHSRVPIETLCVVIKDGRQPNTESSNPVEAAQDKQRKMSVAAAMGRKASVTLRTARKQSTVKVRVGNRNVGQAAKDTKKKEVAEYFVAQLYLAGALCLDRNYVAIRILESHYSYENLLSVLQTKTVVNEIKAPVCSLLHSLYIDREPQVAIKFPRLIRTSVSLGGGDENELNPEPFKFAVIQHIISDYVRTELNIAHCDELSNEMMNLLASLMTFGFYSSTEQLADVINPLLQALEDHRVANVLKSEEDTAELLKSEKKATSTKQVSSKGISRRLRDISGKTNYVEDRSSLISRRSYKALHQKGAMSVKSASVDEDSDDDESTWYAAPLAAAKSFLGGLFKTDAAAKGKRVAEQGTQNSVSMAPRRGSVSSTGGNDRRGSVAMNAASLARGIVVGESNSTDGRRSSLTLTTGNPTNLAASADMQKSSGSAGPVDERYEIEEMILNHMQSHEALCLVLSLVVATTILSIMSITDAITFSPTGLQAYYVFDLFVSVVFMADLIIRYTCVTRIQSNFTVFFHDIFNDLDAAIVAMDVILLSIGGFGSSSFAFTKGLKAVRFARVSRVVRAARILTRIAKKSVLNEEWIPPSRYSHIEPMEAETVTGILRVISLTKQRIQDRQLGSILKSFVSWYEDSNSGMQRDPVEAYRQSMTHESGTALIPEKKFDDILLDVVMYSDSKLVEEALHMLMVHKSQERLLLEATSKIQIISKPEVEAKYKDIVVKLRSLRNTAETFEIWGDLRTPADLKIASGMIESLNILIEYIKVHTQGRTVESEAHTFPDVEMQQLFVNLDALTTFMMIQEALTAESDKPAEIILEIVRRCNEMIGWFVKWNPENQALVFKHLSWFIDRIDYGVGSSSVIKAILWSNRSLIKESPKTLISTCAQKIIEFGQKPDYLDVLVGLTHVADTGDSGVLNIRNEIAKVITNVERSGIFSTWCAAPGTKE